MRSLYALVRCSLVLMLLATAGSAVADDHLLLTEFVVTPTAGEYIEIINPTASPINLSGYYLADHAGYASLPAGTQSTASSDFIVGFPNYTLGSCEVIIIAFDGAGFLTTYGVFPNFEMKSTEPAVPDMINTDLGATAGLTNGGEHVVLFFWDGQSDLVSDVDIVRIGTPSSGNEVANKTGLSVDGPDADSIASTYANDAYTMPTWSGDPGFGFSANRIAFEGANETSSGGNGITGHDETTENINVTWDGGSTFGGPTPGDIPQNLVPLVCNPILVEPSTWGGIKTRLN